MGASPVAVFWCVPNMRRSPLTTDDDPPVRGQDRFPSSEDGKELGRHIAVVHLGEIDDRVAGAFTLDETLDGRLHGR